MAEIMATAGRDTEAHRVQTDAQNEVFAAALETLTAHNHANKAATGPLS